MATPAQTAFFESSRVTGIMQGITDPRLRQIPLTWNDRIPDVPATDEEVTAKYVGTLQVADLIADDAKAVTYSQGRFQFQTTQVPNIKMGIAMNQAMINALGRIRASGGVQNDDVQFFTDRWTKNVADAKFGVELRKEILKIAMILEGYNYDRLGIKLTNVSWGGYSDLRIQEGTAWTSTSATGLTTIQNLIQIGRQRYGITFNRATMSTANLRALVAQTEFQTQVKTIYPTALFGGPVPVAPLQSDAVLKKQVETLIAGVGEPFTIELDDRRYWSQDSSGKIISQRAWPIDAVGLTDSSNDGNSNAYDFANCVVTESIVGSMFNNSVVGQIPANSRGPIGYTTLASPDLNAPGTVTWAVARGFPRKHMNQASAVIRTGVVNEIFDASLPVVL